MLLDQAGSGFAPQNIGNSGYSVMSYDEFLDDFYRKGSEELGMNLRVPSIAKDYSFWGDLQDRLNGTRSYYEKLYQDYLNKNQREYEQQQINDARAFTEYMDSSKYQRMVKDLKVAGLNPALAVQNGIGAASVNSGSSSYSTSALKHEGSRKSNDGNNLISSVLNAAVRLIAAAIIAG